MFFKTEFGKWINLDKVIAFDIRGYGVVNKIPVFRIMTVLDFNEADGFCVTDHLPENTTIEVLRIFTETLENAKIDDPEVIFVDIDWKDIRNKLKVKYSI